MKLLWKKNAERDVASYRLLRRTAGSSTAVLVGTTDPATTSFADVGLANGVSYSWTVVARDTCGNDSPPRPRPCSPTAATRTPPFPQRYATCPTATVTVSTRAQLLTAISAGTSGHGHQAQPGQLRRQLRHQHQGDADKPMWICGPRTAVFDNADFTKGYGFRVNGANNVVLAGMTVRNVQKGVAVLYARTSRSRTCGSSRSATRPSTSRTMTTDSTVIGNTVATTGLNAKTTARASTSGPRRATGACTTTASPTTATATSSRTT